MYFNCSTLNSHINCPYIVKFPLCKALLLEYIPDLQELALHNLNRNVGDASMPTLVCIHEAHILHGDFTPRNILVGIDSGCVVIVHFRPFIHARSLHFLLSQEIERWLNGFLNFQESKIFADDNMATQ